jgi:membrane protease YdiL (CAAX protease family)
MKESTRGAGAAASAYLGLVYGWVAYRTGTIRYTIPAHILLNAMGLGFALFENRILDRNTAQMVNPNMEWYLLPGQLPLTFV